ncbi:MAG: tyrosine--tRNA ligase [Nanoarchaeota archaeon]|nr:tyrosine--tRNA ligase [Nanoarchaeota archaeon]
MDNQKRLDLILRNTQEVVSIDELNDLLNKKKKPVVYLGTAITGRPHISYFVWVIKLADFLKAGFKVKLLLADIHGSLDGTSWDVLDKRYKYYNEVIHLMFKSLNVDIKNFELVKGSSFQTDKKYVYDLLKLSTMININDAKRSAAEVVKFGDNPKLGGLLYPLMQSLDEEHLGVDVQYGGVDQRKILMFARENLPKLGYKPRVEIMTPIIPGLTGTKMSASDPKSKIDLLDDEKTVSNKIRGAVCPEGIVEDNGVLAFLKYVIMVIKQDKGEPFIIERPEKFGGNITYKTYEEIEKDFVAKKLHPLDLKNGLAKELNLLLTPFRAKAKSLEKLSEEAYR